MKHLSVIKIRIQEGGISFFMREQSAKDSRLQPSASWSRRGPCCTSQTPAMAFVPSTSCVLCGCPSVWRGSCTSNPLALSPGMEWSVQKTWGWETIGTGKWNRTCWWVHFHICDHVCCADASGRNRVHTTDRGTVFPVSGQVWDRSPCGQ